MTREEKRIAAIGHATFAVLAGMALWFWQERTLILDAAFQSYLFIAGGSPAIMVERFGAVAVQLLPVLGVKLGWPLSGVLMAYSVSVVWFHHVLFACCLHGLKDARAALSILIFNVLLTGDCFYWMQNELLQAISLAIAMWAVWERRGALKNFRGIDFGLAAALAATVVYYHPLVFFPLVFWWCRSWLRVERGGIDRPFLLAAAAGFALLFCSKYIFRQPNFYDRGMTGQYVRELEISPEKLFGGQGFRDFAAHLTGSFALWLPGLFIVLWFYARRRQWLLAGLTAGVSGFYLLLVLWRFRDDDRWYIAESHLQALGVFIILPMVFDLAPGFSGKQKWVWNGAVLVLTIRLLCIFQSHGPYTERLAYLRSVLAKTAQHGGQKFVAEEADTDRKQLMMYWGLPFETLQMSALGGPDAVRVVAVAPDAAAFAGAMPADSMVSFLMVPRRAFGDLPGRFYRVGAGGGWRVLRLSEN